LPVGVVAVVTAALGTAEAFHPVLQGLALAAVALVWLAWRRRRDGRADVPEPPGAGPAAGRAGRTAVLLAAAGAAALAAPAVVPDGRETLRDHVTPPLDLQYLASPLAAFHRYVDEWEDTTLFTVEGWAAGYRLRLAVLDSYDGLVMNVAPAAGANRYDRRGAGDSGAGDGASGGAGDAAAVSPGEGEVTLTVTVGEYSGVWVPSVAAVTGVTWGGFRAALLAQNLYYNAQADALVATAGLAPGDVYTLTVTPATVGAEEVAAAARDRVPAVAAVDLGPVTDVPGAIAARAQEWGAGAQDTLDQVQRIVAGLRQGFFSHGRAGEAQSDTGHSRKRLDDLLADPAAMVGDDEQYAVAAALMLRHLGLPARVVMGFYPDADPGALWEVTGADVHAWVEVAFDGFGWVVFDPAPDEDNTPLAWAPEAATNPQPQVLQPPLPAEEPVADEPSSEPREPSATPEEPGEEPARRPYLLAVGAAGGVGLVVVGPPLVIAGLKRRRRRRRRTAPDPAQRVAAGWQEVLDRATDLGEPVPAAATRRQASRLLAVRYASANADWEGLAAAADRCFAPQPPAPAEADAYWRALGRAQAAWARALPRGRRLKAAVSTASLRPGRAGRTGRTGRTDRAGQTGQSGRIGQTGQTGRSRGRTP
jgi:hypothetical protein